MTHTAIARWLLVLVCAGQGAGTVAIDLNRTHAANPLWLRHARFHLVWQAISYTLLSLIEVGLVLTHGPARDEYFYLAAILARIPMVSCLAAFASRGIYGGALFDPNGIPPVSWRALGREIRIELNMAAEVIALVVLLAAVALYRH